MEILHTAKTTSTKKKAKAWIAHLEEQLQDIEIQEKFLEGIKNNWLEVQKEIKRFENWCITHREGLDIASYQDKRTCLEYLGVRVRVYRYGTRPRHKIDFTPPSILKKFTSLSKQT